MQPFRKSNPLAMADSNWLQNLVKGLSTHIFNAEIRRLTRQDHEFVRENARLGGSADGFLHQGMFFTDLDPRVQSKGQKGALHPSLASSVDAHIKDRKNVQFERARVEQTLVILLQQCRDRQDIFDALPNALHETLYGVMPQTKGLSRTRPEAWTIKENERATRQYDKLREKIEFYSVSKLLY